MPGLKEACVNPPRLFSVQVSASAVLEDSEAVFADMTLRLEKTKAEVKLSKCPIMEDRNVM